MTTKSYAINSNMKSIAMSDNKFLEQLYECIILPRYSNIDVTKVIWIDHGKVGLDAWAHHFRSNEKEYVLLYEDFPGNEYLNDELSHEVIKIDGKSSIELRFGDDAKQVPNITGWFTLFQEK